MKVKQNIISFLLGIAFTLTLGFTSVFEFTLSSDTLYVDGVRVDKAMYKYEGSNHLPVRATAEALGANVEYANGRIDITTVKPGIGYAGGLGGYEEFISIIIQAPGWEGTILDGFDSVEEMQEFYGITPKDP